MEFSRNPFRYGADFDLGNIVGRRHEVIRAERAIRDGQRLFLIAPRGFGKTSILRTAQANMSREGTIVLYVNAETSPDVGKLVGEIIAGVAAQVYENAEDGIQKAGQFFSHLEPTFGFSAVEQKMSVTVGIDLSAGKYRPMEVLAATLDSLDRFAQTLPESRPLAIIIDEFSALMTRYGVVAEGQIRAVAQRHRNFGYIFAGSNVGLMMDMTTKYTRAFYHGGENLYLRRLPSADFAAWLHQQFKDSGCKLSNGEPIRRILSLAGSVPYYVQMLAHNCWNEMQRAQTSQLTVELVISAFRQTIQSLHPSFEEKWNRLTPLQQKTLDVVQHYYFLRLKPSEIAYCTKSPASSVRSALRALYTRNILWDDWDRRKAGGSLQDPFFDYWISGGVDRAG
jgi:hypothetical protein